MKITAQRLNNGITFSKAAFEDMNEKYIGMYYRYCYNLYDMGYLTTPSYFDCYEFKNALMSEYPSVISEFRALDGKIDMTWEHIELYLYKCTDKDLKYVLGLYAGILKCLDAFNLIEAMRGKIKFKKSTDEAVLKPRFSVTNKVLSTADNMLASSLAMEAMLVPDGYRVSEFSFREVKKKVLCEYIGISDEVFAGYKQSGKALFLEGYSFDTETRFISLILKGSVTLDGRYGAVLSKAITEYYGRFYSGHGAGIQCISFEEYVFLKALDSCIKSVEEYKAVNTSLRDYFLTDECVYFLEPVSSGSSRRNNVGSVGAYVFDWYNREELSGINNMLGVSGEYISAEDVKRCGFEAKGLPIMLYTTSAREKYIKKEYYPLCRVFDNKGHMLQPLVGASIEFSFNNYKGDIEGLYDYLMDNMDFSSDDENFKKAVCELVVARVCVEYDLQRSTCRHHANEVRNWAVVDEAVAIEADNLFNLIQA